MAEGAADASVAEPPREALVRREVKKLPLRGAVPSAEILNHRLAPARLPRGECLVTRPAAPFSVRERPAPAPHPPLHKQIPQQPEALPNQVAFHLALPAKFRMRLVRERRIEHIRDVHQLVPKPRDEPPPVPTPGRLQVDHQRRRATGRSVRRGPWKHIELDALFLSAKDAAHHHRLDMRGDKRNLFKPFRKQLGESKPAEATGRELLKGRVAPLRRSLRLIHGAALGLECLRLPAIACGCPSAQLKKDDLFSQRRITPDLKTGHRRAR